MSLREKLLDLAFRIVASEEGRKVEVITAPAETSTAAAVHEPYVVTGTSVVLPSTIAEIGGDGVIEELNVVSKTGNYRVKVLSGGRSVLNASFRDLQEISQYVSWVSAVFDEERGTYALTLYNIPFIFNYLVHTKIRRIFKMH